MWARVWRGVWNAACRFGAWYVSGCSSSLAALGHPDPAAHSVTDAEAGAELHDYARRGVRDLESWLAAQAVTD